MQARMQRSCPCTPNSLLQPVAIAQLDRSQQVSTQELERRTREWQRKQRPTEQHTELDDHTGMTSLSIGSERARAASKEMQQNASKRKVTAFKGWSGNLFKKR